MVQAMEAVRSGRLGTNQAARVHNVPPTTLKDRLSGMEVKRTLHKKGRSFDSFNGEGWWIRYVEHHPTLSLHTSDPLSRVRANDGTPAKV